MVWMMEWAKEMPERRGVRDRLLHVLFFLFFFVLGGIAVLGLLVLFFVVIIIVVVGIFGDDVEVNGMDLRNFELGFTLRATQDLAFLDLVFVDVDFGGTFGAADHGSILRRTVHLTGALLEVRAARPAYYIPQVRSQLP
jgi:hypothetical protein